MKEAAVITAFLDANVLYPAFLRNILLRLASQNLFRARWSAQVHEEWMSALIRNRPDIPPAKMTRTRQLMDTHFQDACVEGYEHLIKTIVLPDADDRHVLAAAIHCGARIIVTANLRDFPDSTLAGFEIEAVHPDSFILSLLDTDQTQVIAALKRLRMSFKNPSRTAGELLTDMKCHGLIASAEALSVFLDEL